MNREWIQTFIESALLEDIGDGDHSSQASIPAGKKGKAQLLVKEDGIIAGIEICREIFHYVDPDVKFEFFKSDGDVIVAGDIGFVVAGSVHTILKCERLALNVLQRMSGIATNTRKYVEAVAGTGAKILDTRKTTPGIRYLEKLAVKLGGGTNHRMGLYDMIMLKDNHIDYCGGIVAAIKRTRKYLLDKNLRLKIEIEVRSIKDVKTVLETGGVDFIMLDNFTPEKTREAVDILGGRIATESSGGITLENVREYAESGVDYISIGALTHHIKSLDISLKAI